jgi:hypothetical protein
MNDHAAISAIQHEKEAAHEWLHQNGDNVAAIEQKLNGGGSGAFPERTMIVKRKAKRKDDGPLEIVCGWIVEHQIGILGPLTLNVRPVTDRQSRTFCQSSHASWADAYVLPKSTKAHSQILRALLL